MTTATTTAHAAPTSTKPYTIISADGHAGANLETYREYLPARYHDDFDAWRGAYKNPFRDLQGGTRDRNWNDERRVDELEADGIVGEVLFPNTVPPFFPTGALVARPPARDDLELRWVGLRAHNRWLADWCALRPERRAGIAQIFLNDVDRAIEEVRFAHEQGLRGGILLPGVPPDVQHEIKMYADPVYEPLWQVCEDLGVVINHHSGNGAPDYGKYPSSGVLWLVETGFFSHRAFWHLILAGVFERHPGLRFVITETGMGWIPESLAQLDLFHAQMGSGRVGELGFAADARTPRRPSEYWEQNCFVGVSFPGPREAKAIDALGAHKVMWGGDYPHHEGTYPYSKESLRLAFADRDEATMRALLGENAARVYGFDLAALDRLAAGCGPTPDEIAVPLDSVPEAATSPAFRGRF
jgi:predicted TIM-barrel fold metal-dependent hydrolase